MVYKTGESAPFMEYTHSTPFLVKHVGFSTGYGSTGEFVFCASGKLAYLNTKVGLSNPLAKSVINSLGLRLPKWVVCL